MFVHTKGDDRKGREKNISYVLNGHFLSSHWHVPLKGNSVKGFHKDHSIRTSI